LRLKPFSEQSVKALWLRQWDNSSATIYGRESGSGHKGAAGELQGLGLIFFVIIGLFSLTLLNLLATSASPSTRFLFGRFLIILFLG